MEIGTILQDKKISQLSPNEKKAIENYADIFFIEDEFIRILHTENSK